MNLQKKHLKFILLLVRNIYLIIALLICFSIIYFSITYMKLNFEKGFLIGKENIFYFYKYALYTHIIFSPLAFITGSIQFLYTKLKIHSLLGKIYVASILFFAIPSSLVMSFFTLDGIFSNLTFLVMTFLWLIFTYKSYTSIKEHKIKDHRKFIIRSFIITNSAILQRLFLFINNELNVINSTYKYTIIVLLSWVPILILFELTKEKLLNQ